MAREMDLFVDHLLDDVVRRWQHEEDFNPAWARNECTPRGRQRMLETCREMHRLEAQQMRGQPVVQVRLNNARGTCAQLVAAQRFCMGPQGTRPHAHVRSEFRTVAGNPRSTRPDLMPRMPPHGSARRPPMHAWASPRSLIESKHVHLPAYVIGGQLNAAALTQRVTHEMSHLQGQITQLRSPSARATIRNRGVRMVYQLGGLPARLPQRAALMAQAAALIRQIGQQRGQSVYVVDADRQRQQAMRHAAARGF